VASYDDEPEKETDNRAAPPPEPQPDVSEPEPVTGGQHGQDASMAGQAVDDFNTSADQNSQAIESVQSMQDVKHDAGDDYDRPISIKDDGYV
jgi:hypothetical protein